MPKNLQQLPNCLNYCLSRLYGQSPEMGLGRKNLSKKSHQAPKSEKTGYLCAPFKKVL
jgi:hypothetical protein